MVLPASCLACAVYLRQAMRRLEAGRSTHATSTRMLMKKHTSSDVAVFLTDACEGAHPLGYVTHTHTIREVNMPHLLT